MDASFNVLDTDGNSIKGPYATGLDWMGTMLTNEKAYGKVTIWNVISRLLLDNFSKKG